MPNFMDLLMQYKWFLLVGTEVVFWVLVGSFLVLRYLLGLRRAGAAMLGLMLLNELLVAALGLLDYQRTSEFAGYQIVVLAFIAYALTFGKEDFRRLDERIERMVLAWKGQAQPAPTPASRPERPVLSGAEHSRKERRGWYVHLAIFVVGQTVFLAMGESWPATILTGELPPSALWTGKWSGAETSTLTLASRVWCVVLVVDFVWSFSYTLFPRRTKAPVATRGFRRG